MTNNKKEVSPSLHKWRFFRSGGFDQVRLETGADLKALDQLDPKLWAALRACEKIAKAVFLLPEFEETRPLHEGNDRRRDSLLFF
jgi:hypothetical protein